VYVLEYVLEYLYVHVSVYLALALAGSENGHQKTRNTKIFVIKGERTRVEKQMLGGGFRALYRWFSASLNRYDSQKLRTARLVTIIY
jgi:hypothetical protein